MNIISNLAIIFQSWTAFLLLLAASYCVIVVQWKMHKSSRLLSAFPSFPTLPIIGSLHLVLGSMRSTVLSRKALDMNDKSKGAITCCLNRQSNFTWHLTCQRNILQGKSRIEKILRLIKDMETPTIFWFSCYPVVFLHKSEDILQTITRNQDRESLGVFEGILEDGILLAKGEKWRHSRKMLNQAFTVSMLKQYMHVFNQQSIVMTRHVGKKANIGTIVDLWPYFSSMNFDTVTENMMDYKVEAQENGENEFYNAISKGLILESKRFNNPLLLFDLFYKIYLYVSGHGEIYKKIQELPKKILEEKIREFRKQKENRSSVEEKPVRTLVEYLLKVHHEQPEFDERQMRVEILNMIYAGSDTTATALCFIVLFLAMHPEVQEKVYEEIHEIFVDDFTEVNMEHCNQLKYMEQCIKETLRRFPIVPVTFRRCPEPLKLSDERVIPANCNVAFLYHSVHRNPSIYPNPEKYDPDRFSFENLSHINNHFMGFGVGNRACIGMKYAMLSMKTQLVHLLRKFRFTTDMQISDIVHVVDLLSRSENGYLVKIWHRRDNHEI